MDSESSKLHIIFFAYMARGQLIPTVDMARLFARHGVKATIITTPLTATLFAKTIEREKNSGFDISVRTIKFPSAEAGLPEGVESLDSVTSPDMVPKFLNALNMLQQPLQNLLQELKPDCLVASSMFPWATEVAEKIGIPRLFFGGMNCFAMCVFRTLERDEPYKRLDSDSELFVVPDLPDQIKLTKLQLPSYLKEETGNKSEFAKLVDKVLESESRSYGVLINSFYELEPAYTEHYRKVFGRRIWHIGPVSSCNRNIEEKFDRGDVTSINGNECLKWLESKKPNSVIYVCFGSRFNNFSTSQLLEIASGLELSGKNFIWVVKSRAKKAPEDWLPEGFEERMGENGLIITGWAPQVLILDHEAIGGFMTHCGWNSTLEAITAGVPMVTWPLQAEQFINEKLITDVLKVGIGVGAKDWSTSEMKTLIEKEDVRKAVTQLMDGEDAEEIRRRAMRLKEKARAATEEGGSSYTHLNSLLEELRGLKTRQ